MELTSQSQELRESTRILIRKLGLLERSGATCCDITMTQCHVIVETGRREKISVNELAELLHLDKSTVSRTVEQLVNKEILTREPDASDRRYVVLRLTEQGRELFRSIEARMANYFSGILESIPAEKREQVIDSLHILSEALKDTRCC